MKALRDRTGGLHRVLGLGGLLLLTATAATLREPPPAPPPTAPPPPALPERLVTPPPQAEPTTKRFQGLVPTYPNARLIPMGRLEANGNPMELAYFEARAPAQDVLEFYAREFRKRGARPQLQLDGSKGGAVSYYDEKRGLLVSVTTLAVGGGPQARTQVFPSITEAPEGMLLRAQAPDSLPRPPGAMPLMRVDDRNPGPGEGSTTLTEVARGEPSGLARFYKEQFSRRGYALKEQRSDALGVELLDFEGPGERISLSLSPVSSRGLPETLVTVVFEKPLPTPEPGR